MPQKQMPPPPRKRNSCAGWKHVRKHAPHSHFPGWFCRCSSAQLRNHHSGWKCPASPACLCLQSSGEWHSTARRSGDSFTRWSGVWRSDRIQVAFRCSPDCQGNAGPLQGASFSVSSGVRRSDGRYVGFHRFSSPLLSGKWGTMCIIPLTIDGVTETHMATGPLPLWLLGEWSTTSPCSNYWRSGTLVATWISDIPPPMVGCSSTGETGGGGGSSLVCVAEHTHTPQERPWIVVKNWCQFCTYDNYHW